MFQIEKKIIQNELTYQGEVIVKYKIEYPQIISNSSSVCRFNRVNLNRALELEKYAKETLFTESKKQYDYNVSNGYPIMIYELVFESTITYKQAPIISLYQDQYTFTGGAHGSTIRTSQSWNLACNKLLTLNDIYTNQPDYLLSILQQINKQIQENGTDLYFDNYCNLILETFQSEQFYLTPQSVVIYFQQYDIAPYSTGIPTFNVHY